MLRDKVERLCREQDLTFAELERRAGIKPGQIKTWNRIESSPRADKVLAVAKVLGTTVEELMEAGDDAADVV